MKSRRKYKSKFFPFSPGIPWNIRNGKYIVPEIDREVWDLVLKDKDIVVTCFGGVLESFFSLAYLEFLSEIYPDKKLNWLGYKEFEPFVRAQRLGQFSNINLKKKMLEDYPTPIFFDAKSNAYLNVLNNYKVTKSYWGKYPVENEEPILKQIFVNSLTQWDNYFPKMRYLTEMSADYEIWKKRLSFRDDKKFILVFADHKSKFTKTLNWSFRHIRELAALTYNLGIKVVAVTDFPHYYQNSKVITIENNYISSLSLIKKAYVVLSSDIDWNFISMMQSDVKIISQNVDGVCDLYENADFLGVDNVISTDNRWVSPMEVFEICKGFVYDN
jgi:hypothetical protein